MVLSTFELHPYVGHELAHQGAISEVVTAAFKASNNTIDIDFYPVKRAVYQSAKGNVVGVYPLLLDSAQSRDFIFSSPMPGTRPGLLRKKQSVNSPYVIKDKVIGIKIGSLTPSLKRVYDTATFIEINTNEQLLGMLMLDRIDYLFVDKYIAADLMVDRLPSLIGKLEFNKESIAPVGFHIGFSRNHPFGKQAHYLFEQGLKKITNNGTLDTILYKHGLLLARKHDKKVLRIATVNNPEMVTMQRLSSIYEKQHPDIELEWLVIDETVLRRRLLSDLAISDGQYDILTIGGYETPIWAERGWLTPIVGLPQEYDEKDLIKNVRGSLMFKKQLFSLPFYAESIMTYYRKDLFLQAKLEMPESPTWEQIKMLASKLHDPSNGIYGICLRGKAGWGENMALLTSMVNAFGGQWFDVNWQAKIDSPQWRQAVSLYVELVTQYGPPDSDKNGYMESLALFANGHCGMWMDATVAASTLFDPSRSKVSDSVSYAPAPTGVDGRATEWQWIWSLAIPASTAHSQEASDFITWATSKAYIELVAHEKGWGAVPPGTRYSTYNEHYKSVAPYADYVLNAIEESNPNHPTLKQSPYRGLQSVAIPEFPAIGGHVGGKINQIITGNITIDQALKDGQEFANKKIRTAGY